MSMTKMAGHAKGPGASNQQKIIIARSKAYHLDPGSARQPD